MKQNKMFNRILSLALIIMTIITNFNIPILSNYIDMNKEAEAATTEVSPYKYNMVVAYFGYWLGGDGNYYATLGGKMTNIGKSPASYLVSNWEFPAALIDGNYEIEDLMNYSYYTGTWADLNYTGMKQSDLEKYYMTSAYVSNKDAVVGEKNTTVTFKANYYPLSPSKAEIISGNIYKSYVAIVVKYVDSAYKANPEQWIKDHSPTPDPLVNASLTLDLPSKLTWNYKEYNNNNYINANIGLDATASTSNLPITSYNFDTKIGTRQADTGSQTSGYYSKLLKVYPNDVNALSGQVMVTGNVSVTDNVGTVDTATATSPINVEIINEKPNAYFTNSSRNYLTLPMNLQNGSSDPENDMAYTSWNIRNSNGDLIFYYNKNLNTGVISKDYSSDYFESVNFNVDGGDLIFAKKGYYDVEIYVKDSGGGYGAKDDTYTKTIYVNSEPQPPTADFKMYEFGYPNESVPITDQSTDPNNDIVSWTWTKPTINNDDGKPASVSGSLSGSGGSLTFAKEGTYSVTLKVKDYTGLEDTVTKEIKIIPPIAVARITKEGTFKENRKATLHMRDSLSPRTDPIQISRNEWTIKPLDGQNPDSIKIDTDTSNLEQKDIVFKETGRYQVDLTVHNNFSDLNPEHSNIGAIHITEIITVVEDAKPISVFNTSGTSPNFFDNPISTTVGIKQAAYSVDNDLINKYKYVIYRDMDEDGSFTDESEYGIYNVGDTNIEILYQQGISGKFKVSLEVTEEFGQPTIEKFVSQEDRRKGISEQIFTVNWIPDIAFELSQWAYTDDTLSIATTLKDEELNTLKVDWTIKRASESDSSNMIIDNIDNRTEKTLNKNGGTIRFKDSGNYELIATVTDEVGQSYSFSKTIRIYPLPTAVVKDAMSFMGTAFTTKENRKYQLDGNSSYASDYFGYELHAIDHTKDYWEIIPLEGQSISNIKVVDGTGELINDDAGTTKYVQIGDALQEDLLFKLQGKYKIRYQVTNSYGKKSPLAEQIITVEDDTAPIINFDTIETVYRDVDDSGMASLLAYNITSNSNDGDILAQYLHRVRYRFDSDNDGSYSDEAWEVPLAIDFINNKATIRVSHVGKYQFELYVKDTFGQETINQFVTEDDRLSSIITKEIEVDNMPPNVDFTVTPSNKVDIVFTVGQVDKSKTLELSTKINNYVKTFLEANNADFIDTRIETIETNAQNLSSSFSWNTDMSSSIGNIAFQNNGSKIQMYGNRRNAGHNKIYTSNNTNPDIYKQEMSFSYNLDFGDNFQGAGVLLNTHVENNKLYGYALMIGSFYVGTDGMGYLYRINGMPTGSTYDQWSLVHSGSYATLLNTVNLGTSGNFNIQTTKTNVTITKNGSQLANFSLPVHYGWGFGFFSDHFSHNCSNIGQFALDNLKLDTTMGKSLDEVLKQPTWRENSTKFIVNLSDVELSELNPSSPKYSVVLSRLMNDGLYFAELGTNTNITQANNFITDNDGKGTFIYNNNPNMDKALQDLATYILNTIRSQAKPLTHYVLLGEEVAYQTFYDDYEDDPRMNFENWRYVHDYDYFQNDLGIVAYDSLWLTAPKITFDKVGKFTTEYKTKDNPVATDDRFDEYRKTSNMMNGPLEIYVHRKPIAQFTMAMTAIDSTKYNLSLTDTSYDLDHTDRVDKGLVAREWSYKEVGEDTWHSGKLTTGYNAKDYLVRLRVRDMDGENNLGVWSDDKIVLITKKAMPPIAQFTLSQTVLPLDKTLGITDTSYDPNGDPIVQWQWKLYKDTTLLGTYDVANAQSSINTQIKSSGIGNYRLTLQVRDNTGVWGDINSTSDIYTQTFRVIPVNYAPTIGFDLVSNESPAWLFPKIDNLSATSYKTFKYRPNLSFFFEELTRFDVTTSDANTDNLGFVYDWTLENYKVQNISNIGDSPTSVKNYTTRLPFTNSFKSQGLEWGAYKITLKVTDKPPIPPYDPNAALSTYLTKTYYIVPNITMVGSYESVNAEVIVGDTIKIKATTNKEVTNVTATLESNSVNLIKKSTAGENIYWESDIIIPESIAESGSYNIIFKAQTNYGGNGAITREITNSVPINITALRLMNFRITNIVNHNDVTFPYTKDMLITNLINYKSGYYVTFLINSKGNPEHVISDILTDGNLKQTLELTKINSNPETWQGKFYTSAKEPIGTIIRIKTKATKGTTTYSYNEKENWNGDSLIVKQSALKDGRINLTR